MKAKEYLQKLKRLDTIIDQKIKEQADLRHMSTSIGSFDYSKDRVQTSRSGDVPYVKVINRIIDLNEEINREMDIYADEKHRIINQIQGLSDARHIDILYKRYVEFKSLEQICVEMGFSYDYIKHLHGYALRDFGKKFLKSTPNST